MSSIYANCLEFVWSMRLERRSVQFQHLNCYHWIASLAFVLVVNVWPNDSVDINSTMTRGTNSRIVRAKELAVRRPLCTSANGLDSIWPNEMDSNRLEIHAQIFAAHHLQLDPDNMNGHLREKKCKQIVRKMNDHLWSVKLHNLLPASSHKCKSMR